MWATLYTAFEVHRLEDRIYQLSLLHPKDPTRTRQDLVNLRGRLLRQIQPREAENIWRQPKKLAQYLAGLGVAVIGTPPEDKP